MSSPSSVNVSVRSSITEESPPKRRSNNVGSPKSNKSLSSDSSFEKSPLKIQRQKPSAGRPPTKQKQQPESPCNWRRVGVVLVLILAVLAMYTQGLLPTQRSVVSNGPIAANLDPEERARLLFETFKGRFQELKSRFPLQSVTFWRTIFGSLRPMIAEPDPLAPAVLMLVVPRDQQGETKTADCVAKQLLNMYSGLFNMSDSSKLSHIHILQDLNHASPASDKRELDDKLQHVFGVARGKGVILDSLESLAPLATLLLHGYCDGDNAPYKDVLFIQIVHTDRLAREIMGRNNYMDEYLTERWISELDEDKIQPLLTRIANNVALVTPEYEQTLINHC